MADEAEKTVPRRSMRPRCASCEQSAARFKCASCESAHYCSKECQEQDFYVHRHACQGLRNFRMEAASVEGDDKDHNSNSTSIAVCISKHLDLTTRHWRITRSGEWYCAIHLQEAFVLLSLINRPRVVQSRTHEDELPTYHARVVNGETPVAVAVLHLAAIDEGIVCVLHIMCPNGMKRSIRVHAGRVWPFHEPASTELPQAPIAEEGVVYPEEWQQRLSKLLVSANIFGKDVWKSAPGECMRHIALQISQEITHKLWDSVQNAAREEPIPTQEAMQPSTPRAETSYVV